MSEPNRACTRCGVRRVARPTDSDWCRDCQWVERHQPRVDAYRGGWVRRGMTLVPDLPPTIRREPDPRPEPRREDLMVMLARWLGDTRIEPRSLGFTCHCGCLLTTADEDCPNCLVQAAESTERSVA